jgi:hypothetical protein
MIPLAGAIRGAAAADAPAIIDLIAEYRGEQRGSAAIDRTPIQAAVSAALAHGTSTVLVAAIEAAAVSRGCVRIMLNNLMGATSFQRGFYAQLGYHHRADVANFVKRLR